MQRLPGPHGRPNAAREALASPQSHVLEGDRVLERALREGAVVAGWLGERGQGVLCARKHGLEADAIACGPTWPSFGGQGNM